MKMYDECPDCPYLHWCEENGIYCIPWLERQQRLERGDNVKMSAKCFECLNCDCDENGIYCMIMSDVCDFEKDEKEDEEKESC